MQPAPTTAQIAVKAEPAEPSFSFTISDGLIIAATFLGPIIAIQVQKWIERAKAKNDRKDWVFHTLMATRQIRLSYEHLRALNSIVLAFDGKDQKSKNVRTAWKAYHHNLGTPVEGMTETLQEQLWSVREDLFIALLAAIAEERGFEHDKVDLKTSGYHPKGVGEMEEEQNQLRKAAIEVLTGQKSIGVKVKEDPEHGR